MLIIDKEMPKNCYDCPCFDIEWSNCNLTKSNVFSHDKDKPDNCPLKEVPAADVQEVKHAYWETIEEEVYGIPTDIIVCTNCDKEYDGVFMAACCADFETDVIHFHFCPYCGARMDEKNNKGA